MEGIVKERQMPGWTAHVPILRRRALSRKQEEHACIQEIDDILRELEAVDSQFNFTDDDDLLDACIHRRNALTAQYRRCLRIAREKGLTNRITRSQLMFEGRRPQWDR